MNQYFDRQYKENGKYSNTLCRQKLIWMVSVTTKMVVHTNKLPQESFGAGVVANRGDCHQTPPGEGIILYYTQAEQCNWQNKNLFVWLVTIVNLKQSGLSMNTMCIEVKIGSKKC